MVSVDQIGNYFQICYISRFSIVAAAKEEEGKP